MRRGEPTSSPRENSSRRVLASQLKLNVRAAPRKGVRKPTMSKKPGKQQDEFMAFMNLHDVFMNASLCMSKMLKAPLVGNTPGEFTSSDRGRFERMWVTSLYVLVEAWRAEAMAPGKAYIESITSIDQIDSLIEQGKNDDSLTKMRQVRDYMCHRDKREYWDAGRTDVAGQLAFHKALHDAFSQVFLAVLAVTARSTVNKCRT